MSLKGNREALNVTGEMPKVTERHQRSMEMHIRMTEKH